MTSIASLGLVERLRNGGQPDLADMAEGLLLALKDIVSSLAEHDDEGMVEHAAPMVAARAAINKATGEQA